MGWNDRRISREQIRKIKRLFGMDREDPLPRCPARDRGIVKKLEAQGDFSHGAPGHVCEKCRCKRVAGDGTFRDGDFYGIGENTGHYGCGFCRKHERNCYASHARVFARNHLKAIQQYGKAVSLNPADAVSIYKHQAELSEHRLKVRKGMDLVVETLEDFKSRVLEKGEKKLTEYVSGGKDGAVLKKMSDKTRMQLACELGKTLASITKDNYAISSEEFISQDEVALVAYRVVEMTFGRFLSDPDAQKAWLNEFTGILNSIRGGSDNARKGPEQDLVEQIPQSTQKGAVEDSGSEVSELGDDEAEPETEADEVEAEPETEEEDPPPWET